MCVAFGERALGSQQDDDGVKAESVKRPSGLALKGHPWVTGTYKGVTREKTRPSWGVLEALFGEILPMWK